GPVVVEATLHTTSGELYSQPVLLHVNVTQIGAVALVITVGAAVVLFLAAGLRVARRVRTARRDGPGGPGDDHGPEDPDDPGRPGAAGGQRGRDGRGAARHRPVRPAADTRGRPRRHAVRVLVPAADLLLRPLHDARAGAHGPEQLRSDDVGSGAQQPGRHRDR